jgi:hypothetical protein
MLAVNFFIVTDLMKQSKVKKMSPKTYLDQLAPFIDEQLINSIKWFIDSINRFIGKNSGCI